VLPVLCDPKRTGQADACVVRYDQVKDIIKTTKSRCVGIFVVLGCQTSSSIRVRGMCVCVHSM
jgi:hypothetical protein